MNITAIITALSRFHNVVLEGVPGVGKTIAVDQVASAWHLHTGRELGGKGKDNWAITLHPSTAYEDFVEGLRPVGETSGKGTPILVIDREGPKTETDWFAAAPGGGTKFEAADGFFLRACKKALQNPTQDHIVLLDELNRANVPKVMGDLLTTIEHSKRAPWDAKVKAWDIRRAAVVALPYTGRPFFVPANLYVIATTNTSDRSVASMDAAMRRRLAFLRLEPMKREPLLVSLKSEAERATSDPAVVTRAVDTTQESVALWESLNEGLLRPCLGPDAVLGHSYLFTLVQALIGCDDSQPVRWSDVPELDEIHRMLTTGQTAGGEALKRAFWMELGQTGGADNQADLPKSGSSIPGRGQPHLLVGAQANATTGVEYEIKVRTGGATKTTVLKYYGGGLGFGGKKPNKMWRWQQLPEGLVDSLLVVVERAPRDLEIQKVPAQSLPLLKAASDWDRNSTGGKHWGVFRISKSYETSTSVTVQQSWRFEILPQLADTLVAGSAELLLDKDRREHWFEGHADLDEATRTRAMATLAALDQWLAQLGLRITVPGTGIGRAPLIEEVEQPSDDDVEAAAPAPAAPAKDGE